MCFDFNISMEDRFRVLGFLSFRYLGFEEAAYEKMNDHHIMRKRTIIILVTAIIIAGGVLFFLGTRQPAPEDNMVTQCRKVARQARSVVLKEKDRLARLARAEAKKKAERAARLKAENEKEKQLQASAKDLSLTKDYHDEFVHGNKGKRFQKYIVLHDTEGGGTASNVVSSWLNQGKRIAAHFVVNKDGTIVQCVPMDKIAHHAGFGDAGHNEKYGVTDESRDDKAGTESIGSDFPDYGMNSYSIGIEMIHNGSSGEEYPQAQLAAIDALIAYIDAYYGKESRIIDHKMWRSGNSDTSKEFAGYLENYMDHRRHN